MKPTPSRELSWNCQKGSHLPAIYLKLHVTTHHGTPWLVSIPPGSHLLPPVLGTASFSWALLSLFLQGLSVKRLLAYPPSSPHTGSVVVKREGLIYMFSCGLVFFTDQHIVGIAFVFRTKTQEMNTQDPLNALCANLLEPVPAGVEIAANGCKLTHMEGEKLEKAITHITFPPLIKPPPHLVCWALL